jgi:hypothetical protein
MFYQKNYRQYPKRGSKIGVTTIPDFTKGSDTHWEVAHDVSSQEFKEARTPSPK